MTAAVEKMAYRGEVPWHGLGFKVDNNLSPEQMLKAAGLDWKVIKEPVYLKDGTKVDGQFQLIRDTDRAQLSPAGAGFKPVQNDEAMDFFKKFVVAGHMEMETAGSLHGGRYVWGLAKIKKGFTLGKGDKVEGYLLLASPHVRGKALIAQFTGIRVVCWNTYSAALGSTGGHGQFRMPHSMSFNDDMKKQAEMALGIAKEQLEGFQKVAELLSKKKAKESEVNEYFMEVLRLSPEQLAAAEAKVRAKKAGAEESKSRRGQKLVSMFQHALTNAPGQALPSAIGSWWGAFNAVTYVVDHEMGESRDIGLRNALIGWTAVMKRRALNLAVEKAK